MAKSKREQTLVLIKPGKRDAGKKLKNFKSPPAHRIFYQHYNSRFTVKSMRFTFLPASRYTL